MDKSILRANGQFNSDGYTVIPDLFTASECDEVAESIDDLKALSAGSRVLLKEKTISAFAENLQSNVKLNSIIPRNYLAIQCILFDKCPGRNWLVPFHRDVHVPLNKIVNSDKFSDWSVKENTLFAKASNDFLDKLVAVRISLDDSLIENGPLRLIPGSHRWADVSHTVNESGIPVIVPKGSGLILNPLVLHASSKMAVNSRRRILHFLFGPCVLPDGAEWA